MHIPVLECVPFVYSHFPSVQVQDDQEASAQDTDPAEDASKGKMEKDINPGLALALLVADLGARVFCLSILWVAFILAILVSNAALCVALIHR